MFSILNPISYAHYKLWWLTLLTIRSRELKGTALDRGHHTFSHSWGRGRLTVRYSSNCIKASLAWSRRSLFSVLILILLVNTVVSKGLVGFSSGNHSTISECWRRSHRAQRVKPVSSRPIVKFAIPRQQWSTLWSKMNKLKFLVRH